MVSSKSWIVNERGVYGIAYRHRNASYTHTYMHTYVHRYYYSYVCKYTVILIAIAIVNPKRNNNNSAAQHWFESMHYMPHKIYTIYLWMYKMQCIWTMHWWMLSRALAYMTNVWHGMDIILLAYTHTNTM